MTETKQVKLIRSNLKKATIQLKHTNDNVAIELLELKIMTLKSDLALTIEEEKRFGKEIHKTREWVERVNAPKKPLDTWTYLELMNFQVDLIDTRKHLNEHKNKKNASNTKFAFKLLNNAEQQLRKGE